ncbi:phage tail protein [Streptomyces sp. ET3-23]|uniref:phage tail protein n=1 Tax=Streptomyces sp. ET3-23 TaxID=2885643 RepID=UPI001D129EB7|nr:phage tail protein [Streptomyces sp. ET3-23]MCC2279679.1 phage tail protein [Streptomyces sp. ET3-23]
MSLTQSFGRAGGAARNFRTTIDAAGRAAGTLGRQAGTANTNVSRIKTSAQQSTRELKGMKTAADQAAKSVAKVGKEAGKGGPAMAKFQGGLKKADGGVKGLNKSMKGNVIGMLLGLLAPLIEKVVEVASRSKAMQKITKVAFDVIGKVVGTVMKAIGPLMKSTGALISKVWNGIKAAILPIALWIGSAIPDAFHAVSSALSSAWGGLSSFAGSVFNGILWAVKAPINGVIGLVNSAIGALNGISVTIPGWVPFVGGKTFGVHIPSIPMLAEGGIVAPRSGGVPAIVAEAGESEAVMPLSKLDRLLTRTAVEARLAAAGVGARQASGAGFHIENYYATQASSPQDTARALMFLAKARG